MLPIEQIKAEFLCAIEQETVLVLTAPPGAGKSTVLPLWLLETRFANQTIYLLQPRRVAAKNIACYLAQQLGEPVGQTIGYRLRNESKISADTKLEVITEGILTQLLQNDPELSQSSLILFDEFHERSIQADLAFALARDCQQGLREDLTLVLMSATLASEDILQCLPEAKLIESEGRSFPVTTEYQPVPKQMFWREHALKVIRQKALSHQGSTLVFLPGVADIKFLAEGLSENVNEDLVIAPLYGELSLKEQQQAIQAIKAKRKIVLSTNVAETSLTIEGISQVIDAGFEKIAVYDNQTLTNQLVQKRISKASAIQRAGRAGRLSAGHCIRLYSEDDFTRRSEQAISDIQQTDLLPVLIEAARWGVAKLSDLPFVELPNERKEQLAWQELIALNIVDNNHKLTSHGKVVATLSCHPRYAHMLVAAKQIEAEHKACGLINLACLLAALLEERDIFSRDVAQLNADIGARVDFLIDQATRKSGQPKITRVLKQARQLAKQLNISWQPKVNREWCGALLALAYPERLAKNRFSASNGQCAFLAANGKGLYLNNDDVLATQELLVAASTIALKGKQLVSLAASVELHQLLAWDIAHIHQQAHLSYNEQKDAIVATDRKCLGKIVLEESPAKHQLTEVLIAEMWAEQLAKKGIAWLNFSDRTLQLISRINWLASYQPKLGFNEMSNAWLVENVDKWLTPYVGMVKKKSQLLALDFSTMINSTLDYDQQQQLAKCAPTHFVGPTGRQCQITYSESKSPKVSLPMQEMYGQAQSPQVGDVSSGKGISLVIELLSPAGRPIQLTQDLAGFWQGSYNEVQKEMKGRYPKHYWPSDPANAQATNKTKKYM